MATTRFSDHLLEGNHASRPAFGDVPEGTLYSCTTHGLIYQSDGAAWNTWATLGGSALSREVIRKASTETVVNNTLQNDNDFTFAIAASEVWVAVYHLFLQCASATPDFKYGFTVPSGATVRYGNHALIASATGVTADAHMQTLSSGNPVLGVPASADGMYATLVVTVLNSTNAGNVVLQWAQSTTDGSNGMSVLSGSFMIAEQVA